MIDLGPQPEPRIEPGEPNPGGVDAVEEGTGPVVIPDLTPSLNPAVEERAPDPVVDEVRGSGDTSTQQTRSDDVREDDAERGATE